MTNPLVELNSTDPSGLHAYVVQIVSVDSANGTCVIDPDDGEQVLDVPYYGGTPIVGDLLVCLHFDQQLAVIAGGEGGGGGADSGLYWAQANAAVDPVPGTTPAAAAQVPGLLINVAVGATTDKFLVTATLDFQANTAALNAGTVTGNLYVGGVVRTGQPLFTPGSTATANSGNGFRGTISQTWLVTGLAAGTHEFKIMTYGTIAATWRVNAQHSTLSIWGAGARGSQGPAGATGPTGPTGDTGPSVPGPTGPAGPQGSGSTVVSAHGVTGDGSPATPVSALTSGVWGQGTTSGYPDLDAWGANGSTVGQPVYVDTAGNLRAAPNVIQDADSHAASDLPGTYPVGESIMALYTASAGRGWPYSQSATVVTIRRTGDTDANANAHQWWFRTSSTSKSEVQYRTGSSAGWAPWLIIGGEPGLPDPVDTYVSADQTISATVRGTSTPTAVRAQVTNPHPSKRMLVRHMIQAWVNMAPGGINAAYVDTDLISGGTNAISPNSWRSDNFDTDILYTAANIEGVYWVAAGATVVAGIAAARTNANFTLRYAHSALVPLRYEG